MPEFAGDTLNTPRLGMVLWVVQVAKEWATDNILYGTDNKFSVANGEKIKKGSCQA